MHPDRKVGVFVFWAAQAGPSSEAQSRTYGTSTEKAKYSCAQS